MKQGLDKFLKRVCGNRVRRVINTLCVAAALVVMAGYRSGLVEAAAAPLATYTGPNGIRIVSYHPAWTDQAKLKLVWDELMRNTHFGEISALAAVEIRPGQYNSSYRQTITSQGQRKIVSGKILLYPDAGKDEPLERFLAHTLAHEYGHHFTLYYLRTKENASLSDSSWVKTGYARIRGLLGDRRVSPSAEHEWDPAEIAASDYIQLFGSPNARRPVDMTAIRSPGSGGAPGSFSFFVSSSMYNIQPQENMELPLAAQVPGLKEYWLRLAGHPEAVPNQPPTAPVLALTGAVGDEELVLEWSRSLDDKQGPITYTLLEYRDPAGRLGIPVSIQVDGYRAQVPRWDGLVRWYRVLAQDADGFIVSSNILRVDHSRPEFGNRPPSPLFRDVPVGHWAMEFIAPLVKQGVFKGYVDATFRPNQAITRAEFAAVLCTALGIAPDLENSACPDISRHWARGYINAAVRAGFIAPRADGRFYPDEPITRAAAARASVRAAGLGDEGATPAAVPTDAAGHWAEAEIRLAIGHGIMSGVPGGLFRPDASLTRAEAAKVIYLTLRARS